MSLEALPEWLKPLWHGLMQRRERLPHALLLSGPPGSGKRLFAEHLAHALLCSTPDPEGFACGHCAECRWMTSGNHPDYFTLIPAADEAEDEDAEQAESGKKEKAKSTQIVIDQVRALQASLEVGAGGHAGGLRVVIVDPAEAMNVAAANSVLKALEEPLGGTVYILVSHAPRRLLPTIRSRCQVLDFPRPERTLALTWLRQNGVTDEAMLGFASGLPIAARAYAETAMRAARKQLAGELIHLNETDPLKLAADWEARLKLKASVESGFTLITLLAWTQRWLADGVRVANGLRPRFFEDYDQELRRAAQGKAGPWMDAYRSMQAYRRVAQHPLNARLFLEDLTLTLRRVL